MYCRPDQQGSYSKMIQVKITGNATALENAHGFYEQRGGMKIDLVKARVSATAVMYSSGFSRRVETGSPGDIVYLPFA